MRGPSPSGQVPTRNWRELLEWRREVRAATDRLLSSLARARVRERQPRECAPRVSSAVTRALRQLQDSFAFRACEPTARGRTDLRMREIPAEAACPRRKALRDRNRNP